MFHSVKQQEKITVRQDGMENATAIAFVTLAENGSIDEITASEHAELFSPWEEGIDYTAGALRQYEGVLYKCVQDHTSQADWTPDVAVSLWTRQATRKMNFLNGRNRLVHTMLMRKVIKFHLTISIGNPQLITMYGSREYTVGTRCNYEFGEYCNTYK